MKRSIHTMVTLLVTILVAAGLIFILRNRNVIEHNGAFMNLLLGIVASSVCMVVGEIITFVIVVKKMTRDIDVLYDDLYPIIFAKGVRDESAYIQLSYEFVNYQDRIRDLYSECVFKKTKQARIITLLYLMSYHCKSIRQCDMMKRKTLELVQGDYKTCVGKSVEVSESPEKKEELDQAIRKGMESFVKYCDDMNQSISMYVKDVKELEDVLKEFPAKEKII